MFGVWNHTEASAIAYLGLQGLQHRGQEAAGIVSSDGGRLYEYKGPGHVTDVFDESIVASLKGKSAIGHVRYSTSGGSSVENAQPILAICQHGSVAIAHNGNLPHAQEIRQRLEKEGSIFHTTSDTEVICHLYAKTRHHKLVDRLKETFSEVTGAYSLAILTEEALIAVRDPFGFRPLCLGKINESFVVSSESCALDIMGATFIREVNPGEILIISDHGLQSYEMKEGRQAQPKHCVFEFIYFAKPSSMMNGRSVYVTRRRLGELLASYSPAQADLVVPVPDSGVPAALGYARASGIPFEMGLVRSHYVGRTFIEPKQSIRDFGVRIKHSPVRDVMSGKRLVVIDDSIVRGTTMRKIITMLKDAGASEIHVRITAPPTVGPCFYGIDTPTKEELIANRMSVDEIRRYICADSLSYLPCQALYEALDLNGDSFCDACFSLKYPV